MIFINGFLHKNKFYSIIEKCFLNRHNSSDTILLKEIIIYNYLLCRRYLDEFAHNLLSYLSFIPYEKKPFQTKGVLKDRLVMNPPYVTPRILEMIENYKQGIENYYRETPVDGIIYEVKLGEEKQLVATTRIKRIRRIAEKGSRRIIDHIFEQIKKKADLLAEERAKLLGISKSRLITPQDEMIKEFQKAENRVKESLKEGISIFKDTHFVIDDVTGMKIIGDDEVQKNTHNYLLTNPRTKITEDANHRGEFNARKFIVQYKLDKDYLLSTNFNDKTKEKLISMGMNPERIDESYKEFILSGEDEVAIELILCNYEEMLESEIGRSMHEERIIAQRTKREYSGAFAKSVEYLMEFLFAFSLSNKTQLSDMPIKPWINYMPDYFDKILRDLYNMPSYEALF